MHIYLSINLVPGPKYKCVVQACAGYFLCFSPLCSRELLRKWGPQCLRNEFWTRWYGRFLLGQRCHPTRSVEQEDGMQFFVNHGCHDPDHILLCKPHRYDSERWFDCGYGLAIYRLLSTWYLRTFRVAGLLRFVFPYDIKFCSQKASRKTWSWKNPIDTPHLCQVQNAWWWWWWLFFFVINYWRRQWWFVYRLCPLYWPVLGRWQLFYCLPTIINCKTTWPPTFAFPW